MLTSTVMTDDRAEPLAEVADFVYEMGFLKQVARAGWALVGISDPESVAEHSFRTALIGFILASEEGADPARTALLCLFHDSQESRTGDISSVSRPYVTTASNIDVSTDQLAGFPQRVANPLLELVAEYEAGNSLEAHLAHEADRLECVFQAREYQAQRAADTTRWIENCAERIQSGAGRRLLEAALNQSPTAWWQQFQDTYNQRARKLLNRRKQSDDHSEDDR